MPVNVVVPVPVFTKLPSPEITPLKVVSVFRPPAVSVTPLPTTMVPAPAIEPTVSLVATS